jgi:Ran-binding protein 1
MCSVLPDMTLKPNCGSDKAWVWTTPADFADEEAKPELLATRFSNAESKIFLLCSFVLSCKQTTV